MTWQLPDTYHSAGHGRGTATLKFYEGRDILVTSSLSRCRSPPPAETALWAGVGGGPWVGAGIGAAGPGGWGEERAPQGQGDGERQPCAEQADGGPGDEGEVARAEPRDHPDGRAPRAAAQQAPPHPHP